MSAESTNNKEHKVIYLDADTEITEAIEKLKKAREKEVRIVVPARSSLLQSAVNIKLLKKSSKDSDKSLILVTNDKITRNLAGAAGVAIASSVKALAHVPVVDKEADKIPEKIRIDAEDSESNNKEGFEAKHIDLEDDEPVNPKLAKSEAHKKVKKVPDYGKLNKRVWFAIAGVILVVILVVSYIFVPNAKVIVLTKAKKTSLNFNFILDASTKNSSIGAGVLASEKLEITKDVSFEALATGKKEVGTKATGSVNITNCEDTTSRALPAGSKLTSGGKVFLTASASTIPAGQFSGGGSICSSNPITVSIIASEPGDSYNLTGTMFYVTGLPNKISGQGTTSGGVSKTITVLSADDIAAAKAKAQQEAESAKDDLTKKAGSDSKLFKSTIQSDFVDFKTSVQQDNEADKVTVNAKIKYTGFSAKNSDINQLFDQQIKSDLQGNKEIYQNGSEDGQYSVIKQLASDKVQMNVKTSAYYGDSIDKQAIAKSVTGKPEKEVNDIVKQSNSQFTGAEVENWPSMLPNLPLITSRITIEVKVSTD